MTLVRVDKKIQCLNDLLLLSFVAIEGISIDSVTSAAEKIQAIIDEVSYLCILSLKRSRAMFTYFFQFTQRFAYFLVFDTRR